MKLKAKIPGQLSDELKRALGMVDGVPPPWLLNMQRYGPPPAYPNLKIPGLNAPIPEGASFGYHPGGWGKPPVDEVREAQSSESVSYMAHSRNDLHVLTVLYIVMYRMVSRCMVTCLERLAKTTPRYGV